MRAARLANPKSITISEWDSQEAVLKTKDLLNKRGIPTWMDIDGGMETDIFDSMAQGVDNAFCVVCFTSQRYQDSSNCQLELKFAKTRGIPICSVKLDGKGWKPSGWLGLVTAGALWIPLYKDEHWESSIDGLCSQILKHASDAGLQPGSDSVAQGGAVAKL